jgi:hypothetical protein
MGLSTRRVGRHKLPCRYGAVIYVEYEGKNRSVDAQRTRHFRQLKEGRALRLEAFPRLL